MYLNEQIETFKRNNPKRRSLASNFEFPYSTGDKTSCRELRKTAISTVDLNMTTLSRLSKSKLMKQKCIELKKQLGRKILSFKKRKHSKILNINEEEISNDITIWEEEFNVIPIIAVL